MCMPQDVVERPYRPHDEVLLYMQTKLMRKWVTLNKKVQH